MARAYGMATTAPASIKPGGRVPQGHPEHTDHPPDHIQQGRSTLSRSAHQQYVDGALCETCELIEPISRADLAPAGDCPPPRYGASLISDLEQTVHRRYPALQRVVTFRAPFARARAAPLTSALSTFHKSACARMAGRRLPEHP